jgi:hypothetical protein
MSLFPDSLGSWRTEKGKEAYSVLLGKLTWPGDSGAQGQQASSTQAGSPTLSLETHPA